MHAARWRLRSVAIVAIVLLVGCGTARIYVAPTAFTPQTSAATRPLSIGLYLDPGVVQCRSVVAARTPAGAGSAHYGTIEVTYDLGAPLAKTINSTLHNHFREIYSAESATRCPKNASALIGVSFAKQPEIEIHWVEYMASAAGGASVELALALTVQTCDGHDVWRRIVVGYATVDVPASDNPTRDQFQAAMDEALAALAKNLDAAIATADLGRLGHDKGKPG